MENSIFKILNPAPKGRQRVKTRENSAKVLKGIALPSPGRTAHNSKTVEGETKNGVVVVAVGGATRPSKVEPRTTAQQPG